jgi:hypothetical protein
LPGRERRKKPLHTVYRTQRSLIGEHEFRESGTHSFE